MSRGDEHDFYNRLQTLLPVGWFADESPVLSGALTACAKSLAWCHTLYVYARSQTRLATASRGWLDIAAYDFFGNSLIRPAGMSDEQLRMQIRTSLLRERGTRQAVIDILEALTGTVPLVFEPLRIADTGAYGGPAIGYGTAGRYGSQNLPYQAFVEVSRPKGSDDSLLTDSNVLSSGHTHASDKGYVSGKRSPRGVTESQIYAAVAAVKMEGTVVWVRIH
ncbi:hypothetical protein [Pantoea anthophila]|uniref:hypothetical protein n=1 Tax=Pantoea anthophila TaxID=470931 RepID=UPI003321BE99